MKKEDLFQAIGDVDEKKIAMAVAKPQTPMRVHWLKLSAMAACICLLAAAVLGAGFGGDGWFVSNTTTTAEKTTTTTKTWKTENGLATSTKTQGEASITTSTAVNTSQITQKPTGPADEQTTTKQTFSTTTVEDGWYVPRWDTRSTPGKFYVFVHNGGEYVYPFSWMEDVSTDRAASKLLSNLTLVGVDEYDAQYTATVDVFRLRDIDEDLALGVKFAGDDRVYAYLNTAYIPQTLGEFLADSDFANTVSFGGIALFKGGNNPVNAQNVADMHTYLFADGNVKNDRSQAPQGYRVTMSINMSMLGCNNKAFYLYESGHIATNLFGYEQIFFVGEKSVADFIENSYHVTFEQLKEINTPAITTTQDGAGTTMTSTAALPR